MRWPVVAAILLLAACGNPQPPLAGSSPSESANSASATASAAPTATATGCRLPIWLYDRSTNTGSGYYLPVPGSELVPAKPPVTSPNTYASYVSAADRWFPVPRSLVAPDGKHYAYNEASGNPEVDRVHVVDVATGEDHVIAQGSVDTGYLAFDFEADGLYVGRPNNGPGTAPGLWRLDPVSGAATAIDAHSWGWISVGYAYAVVANPTDPVVVQGGQQADTLLRLDIRTHTVQQWFRKRGVFLNVRGFDWSGRPLVVVGDTLADLFVISGQDTAEPLPGGSRDVTFSYVYPSLVASPDGFWFAADQGVYGFSAKTGFQQLWNDPAVKTVLPMVAGPCA